MNTSVRWLPVAPAVAVTVAAAALLLSACGGSDSPGPKIDIAAQPAGLYTVSVGDAERPQTGLLLAATDGSSLLAIKNDGDAVTQLYQRSGNAAWTAAPVPTGDIKLDFLRTDVRPSAALSVASAAGTYASRLAGGGVARFNVTAEGVVMAPSGNCSISGQLSSSPLPNTLTATLQTSGCAGLPATVNGVWVQDSNDAPARFRLLAPNAGAVIDLWVFAD